MKKRGMMVTYAKMTYTDGTRVKLTVYHCRLCGNQRRFIDLNSPTTTPIGEINLTGVHPSKNDLLTILREYETPDFPAFVF